MTNNKEFSQDNIIGNTMLSELYKFNLIPNTKNPACAWRNTKNHYKKHPRGNYGIPTGQVNDIIVLDLDFYKLDANELLANPFIQIYGETPTFDTFTVASPSGGLHYYFKFEENMPGNTYAQANRDDLIFGTNISTSNTRFIHMNPGNFIQVTSHTGQSDLHNYLFASLGDDGMRPNSNYPTSCYTNSTARAWQNR